MSDNNDLVTCDECGSEYYLQSSKMKSLCPECSHVLYGYTNCDHQFENGRCINCCWNGNPSDHIKELLRKKTEK